jgi:hypothetical protein
MLGYFIGEGPSLNTVLNLINEKKYDDARMQRISDLIAMPGMAKVAIIQESTTNESGHLKWDCWGCISHQYQELKMLKFVEEDNIACCIVCNSDYNYGAGTKPSKRNDKGDEDNGDEVIYLEHQPRRTIKKKGTQKKTFFAVPSLQMKDIQSWINDRYNPDGGDQVHCSTPDCGGMCTLKTKMVQCPIILIIEPCAVNTCPIMSMHDIEHELIIDGTRYMLVYVILNSSSHFRGVTVINHQYVLYDGMLTMMSYIDGSECFSKDENYSVGSLWYRKIHSWSSSVKIKVKPNVELPTDKVPSKKTSKKNSTEKQEESSTKPVSTKEGANNSSMKYSRSGVKIKIEGKVNKVPPQTRSPSKRKRTPKNKFSPSDQNNQAQSSKRKKYPIGISIASGSSLGVVANCKWCRGCIMRTQWRAIKKVKREVGVGFDTLQYHFFCCNNALSSDELQQLLDVIGASDEELGLKSAWTAAITKDRDKTAWDWLNEMNKK